MGGLGSGRPSGSGRGTIGSHRAIDVNKLQSEGCLQPGWAGSWQWTSEGTQTGLIALKAEVDLIRLSYRMRIAEGEWQGVEEYVRIAREPCRFGGNRAYFICPGAVDGTACDRRVTKLYGAGRYFLCRHCHRLAYASQREGVLDRAHRRIRKVNRRLGRGDSPLDMISAKPKGMWERTYQRLRDRVDEDESCAETMFMTQGQQLLKRIHQHAQRRTGRKEGFWS